MVLVTLSIEFTREGEGALVSAVYRASCHKVSSLLVANSEHMFTIILLLLWSRSSHSLSVFLIGSRVYNYRLYYLLIVCFSVNAVFFLLFSVSLRCEREIQWENTFLSHWRASRYIPHMLIPNFPEAPPGSFSAVNLVLLEGLYQIKKRLIHITSKLKQNS